MPLSAIENGPPSVALVEVVVDKPTCVGVNRKLYWQAAPGATPPAQFCVTPIECRTGHRPRRHRESSHLGS